MLIKSNSLHQKQANPRPFQDHFHRNYENVISFQNLGRDATLIVPSPWKPQRLNKMVQDYNHYCGHLGDFVRYADSLIVRNFWRKVAKTMKEEILSQRSSTLWLSTAGDGVAWLHARIDANPKYYHHMAYKNSSKWLAPNKVRSSI